MQVELTKAQTEWVDWAIGGMDDAARDAQFRDEAWSGADGHGIELDGRTLTIRHEHALDDLFYRLEKQAHRIAHTQAERTSARAAANAAEKIRRTLEANQT